MTRALVFLLPGSSQTAYTNVGYPSTHDRNRLPYTWPLIAHSLPNRFFIDYLLFKEQYTVTSSRLKQKETKIYSSDASMIWAVVSVMSSPTQN